MDEIIAAAAEDYCRRFSSPLDEISQENESFTFDNHPHAHMHSGHLQGKFLEMISCMIGPVKILEIGTFTGFSALCLCKGLANGGVLHTIEIREEDAAVAKKYFERAGMNDSIKLHVGNAIEIIKSLDEQWDLVFIDADKVNYIEYYKLTLPQVRRGGFLVADNVLFHGQVLENDVKGKNAKAIHAFNEYVAADHSVQQVMLTVRDGLSIIRKL